MENKVLENKELENKGLAAEELEKVNGGDGYYPIPPMPGYPNQPYPNQPSQPAAPRPIRGYKTRCHACGKTGEVTRLPDGRIVGIFFCSCGGRMENVEPLFI